MDWFRQFPLLSALAEVPILADWYHRALAYWGAVRYGNPSRGLYVVGVTGTKGKTTAIELMNAILEAAGKKTALVSSLSVKIGDERKKNLSDTTMPGRMFLQRFFRDARRAGCEYALIEVTSQGVLQHRYRHIDWDAAFLVNVHPEHIEAHGSFENYRDAKLTFLEYAQDQGAKIFLNRDDPNVDFFMRKLGSAAVALYSKDDVEALKDVPGLFPAEFNRENVATAVVLARELGIDEATIRRAVADFRGVPGRMEFVQTRPFAVVVDYAHTPDSLEAVYRALRPKEKGRLVCVLGSAGGGRDKWKRPVMGKIAGAYCEVVVLTSEDPYDENPMRIIEEIEIGIHANPPGEKRTQVVYKIPDRREAIMKAIQLAEDGDLVVSTGKGSEAWIHIAGRKKISWNEREVIEEVLEHKRTPVQ